MHPGRERRSGQVEGPNRLFEERVLGISEWGRILWEQLLWKDEIDFSSLAIYDE